MAGTPNKTGAKNKTGEPAAAKAETAAPEVSRHSAEEWLQVATTRLGVRPWIVRAAVVGLPPERKYTEDEIRGLIQRKLSEPA